MKNKNVTFVRLAHNTIFDNPHPQQITPPLSDCYCASVLDDLGYKTTLIDTFTERYTLEKLTKDVKKTHPDFVIMDVMTTTSKLGLDLSKKLKDDLSIPIFFMGQHSSVLPQTFLFKNTPVDACIIGEPEETISELFKNTEKNGDLSKIDGLAFFDEKKSKIVKTNPRKLIDNLDVLPFPKHSLYMNGKYNFYFPMKVRKRMIMGFMISSRGCPFNCIFCSPTLRVSYGKKYRLRSAKNVVDEMEFLMSEFDVNAIYFQDDNFTFDIKRVERICNEIIKRNLKIAWSVQTRVDQLTRDLARKMKKAGCSSISLGAESGSERILKILKKGITLGQINKSFKILKEERILTNTAFLIGNPTETLREMQMTLDLALKLRPDSLQVSIFTPYPGSELFEKLNKNIPFEKFTHYNDVTINLTNVSSEQIKRFHRRFYKKYYLTFNFMLNYLKWRLSYAMYNLKSEIDLIKSTLEFVFKKD